MALPTFLPEYNDAPAVNTAAVVTLAPDVLRPRRIRQITWSYDADPTGGSLTITTGSGGGEEIVFGPHAITAGGPGFIPFSGGDGAPINQQLTVTLSAAGADVSGALTVSVAE